uniref:Phosducin thioredoxin-like domain-containing protein n=1 Tax=Ditylenchus dipsaci TaxID=166011 RepID=A0A915D784_9BILA
MADNRFAEELLRTAKIVEEKLDQELVALDNQKSDESALEELRRKRMLEMRNMQKRKEELGSIGHGKLEELTDEREFFEATKKSSRIVCHFYDQSSMKSKVMDMLLTKLAAKHFSTRFVKANAEKVPFLIKRLNIRKTPTIGIAIDAKMVDFIRVYEEFGTSDDVKLEQVENRLLKSGVIESQGLPSSKKKTNAVIKNLPKKIIRDRESSNSDDGDDW